MKDLEDTVHLKLFRTLSLIFECRSQGSMMKILLPELILFFKCQSALFLPVLSCDSENNLRDCISVGFQQESLNSFKESISDTPLDMSRMIFCKSTAVINNVDKIEKSGTQGIKINMTSGSSIAHAIVYKLLFQKQIIGFLYLFRSLSSEPFNENEKESAEYLAPIIVSALERIRYLNNSTDMLKGIEVL